MVELHERPRPGLTLAVLAFCGGLVAVMQTITFPLLPELPRLLDTSFSNVSWVATAAVLAGAISNPVLGRLGDMHGKKRVMLASLTIMLIGSVVAALAPSLVVLVIGRALQGVGLATVPLAMSIAHEVLPPHQSTRGIAVVSATLGVGSGIGLPISGLVFGWFGWHAVFWVTAVLAAIALGAAALVLPDTPGRRGGRFDTVGALLLSVALVSLLLPLSKSSTWGWLSPLPLSLYAIGVVSLSTWMRYERRPERPLVDVALFRQGPMLLVNTAGMLLGFAMFNNIITAITLLQTPSSVPHGLGASVVKAGVVMLPGAIAVMLTSPISAWITDRFGGQASMWVGALVMSVGFAVRPLLMGSVAGIGTSVMVVSGGLGIAYGGLPSVIMSFTPRDETASANAIGMLTRSIGSSLSSATAGALLSAVTVTVGTHLYPARAAFVAAFLLSAVAALISAVVASRLHPPRRALPDGRPDPLVEI